MKAHTHLNDDTLSRRMYKIQRILVNPPQFVFEDYGGLTSLLD